MTNIEVEAYALEPNAAVIRIPGRKFPGIVLQGDSLRIISDLVEGVSALARPVIGTELEASLSELSELIKVYVQAYEHAIEKHGQKLPYPKRQH